MSRKIRITFFPADTSRVRSLSLTRIWALLGFCVLTLLCLIGFWLLFSGVLHEDPERRAERLRLSTENESLRERLDRLEGEQKAAQQGLAELEAMRVDALQLTGAVENPSIANRNARRSWNLFQSQAQSGGDPAKSLARARSLGRFYDSTLVILRSQGERTRRLPTQIPVSSRAILTRGYGPAIDPFTGRKGLHAALDFSDRLGAPIFAVGDGQVTHVLKDRVYGITVRISHGQKMESLYAHMGSASVRVGQSVFRGEKIGKIGMSGHTTGPHLHFEIHVRGERVDPMRFLLPGMATPRPTPRRTENI